MNTDHSTTFQFRRGGESPRIRFNDNPEHFSRSLIGGGGGHGFGGPNNTPNHNSNQYNNYQSSPEPDASQFEGGDITFFQAHRPLSLKPGERVMALRHVIPDLMSSFSENEKFTLGATTTTTTGQKIFTFAPGIVETVGERLVEATFMDSARKGDWVTVTFNARCQRGNRVRIDKEINKFVTLSNCESDNDWDIDIEWLNDNEHSFRFKSRAFVDLNEQEMKEILIDNLSETFNCTENKIMSSNLNETRDLLNDLISSTKDQIGELKMDTEAIEEMHKLLNDELIQRAANFNTQLTPRTILLLLADEDACTVAYDSDASKNQKRNNTKKIYEDEYFFDDILPNVHLRGEITTNPNSIVPSTSLGEVAGRFLHATHDGNEDPSTAEHRARLPTYGRVLVQDAASIVSECEADAHASANVGLTPQLEEEYQRQLNLNEIAMASGLSEYTSIDKGTRCEYEQIQESSDIRDIRAVPSVVNERASQVILDTRSLEAKSRDDREDRHVNARHVTDKYVTDLLWAEYPLSMLRELYAELRRRGGNGGTQSGTQMTQQNNSSSSSNQHTNQLWSAWSAYSYLSGVTSSIASFFNCYRRESSAPLWQDRMDMTVPRPLRRAPAGAKIRCSSWHPLRHRLAIGTSDGYVYVHLPQLDDEEDGYDDDVSGWLPFKLRHQFQREIHCMEWQPLSGTGLAVGCETGICFWRLTENGSATDLTASASTSAVHGGHAWCEVLVAEGMGHVPVNGLSWSPDGRKLASCSVSSDHVMIWDVALGTFTPILCVRNIGTTNVSWAPSGHYLFASTLSKVVRVWETKEWTGERWTIPTGPCQDACWNPTGTLLLAAVAGSSELWTFAFHHKPPEIHGVLADLRLDVGHIFGEHVEEDDDDDDGTVNVGLEEGSKISIREVTWSKDAFGQRLAVTINVRGSHLRIGVEEKRREQLKKKNKKKNKIKNGKKNNSKGNKKRKQGKGKKRGKSPKNKKKGNEEEDDEDEGGPILKKDLKNKKKDKNNNKDDIMQDDNDNNNGNNNGNNNNSSNTTSSNSTRPSVVSPRDGEELILIYSVQIQPNLRFTPRGFLRGPVDGVKPYNIEFWPACDTGALLSACWLNGEVTLHPLLYDVKRHQHNGASLMGRNEEDNSGILVDEYDDEVALDLERRDVHNQSLSYGRDW